MYLNINVLKATCAFLIAEMVICCSCELHKALWLVTFISLISPQHLKVIQQLLDLVLSLSLSTETPFQGNAHRILTILRAVQSPGKQQEKTCCQLKIGFLPSKIASGKLLASSFEARAHFSLRLYAVMETPCHQLHHFLGTENEHRYLLFYLVMVHLSFRPFLLVVSL